jgi:hypothetical protein
VLRTAKVGLKGIRAAKRAFDESAGDKSVNAKVERTTQLVTASDAIEALETLVKESADDERPLVQRIYDEATTVYSRMLKKENGK